MLVTTNLIIYPLLYTVRKSCHIKLITSKSLIINNKFKTRNNPYKGKPLPILSLCEISNTKSVYSFCMQYVYAVLKCRSYGASTTFTISRPTSRLINRVS